MTMKNTPRTDDDAPVPLTPTHVLLIAADTVYGDPNDSTPEGKQYALRLLDSILAAASAGGFPHEHILRELLKQNRPTARSIQLARAACDAAGYLAMRKIFDQAGL
ncbi:hypothetical protein [Pseudoduganella violaceinigra]|uniref:hypothetical protein n=1 Tax=Pseudoduganella violaceinigra TaxID=246602 RepID=UPI0003F80C82|nr:hypothetical protein [Pseudoduganella violaceinigra]